MMPRCCILILLTLGIFAAPALATGPRFTPPKPAADKGFADRQLGSAPAGEPQQKVALANRIRADWWSLLGSPALDDVVRQALSQNWTLASRSGALAAAQARLAQARGGNYPFLDINGHIERQKIATGPGVVTGATYSSWGAGATVSYDPDVFGRRRHSIEEAHAAVDDQALQLDAATLTLVGNVAIGAIEIASLRRQIEIVNAILASDQRTIDLVRSGQAAGAATRADVVQAQAQLDRDATMLPPLQQQLAVSRDALALLVGRSPTDWEPPSFDLGTFTLPSELPGTIPSLLVRRRPDILAAEARLHSASAAVGIATADLYPSVDLSAAFSGSGLVSGPAGIAWNLLGGLTAPIFHGGSLRAAKRAAEAEYRASFADYQQVVIEGLGQVADQLHALANDADALTAQQSALLSASEALELNRQGLAAGSIGITQVLDAQRLLDQAQVAAVQQRAQRITDTVKLLLALGIHPDWSGTIRGADTKSNRGNGNQVN